MKKGKGELYFYVLTRKIKITGPPKDISEVFIDKENAKQNMDSKKEELQFQRVDILADQNIEAYEEFRKTFDPIKEKGEAAMKQIKEIKDEWLFSVVDDYRVMFPDFQEMLDDRDKRKI